MPHVTMGARFQVKRESIEGTTVLEKWRIADSDLFIAEYNESRLNLQIQDYAPGFTRRLEIISKGPSIHAESGRYIRLLRDADSAIFSCILRDLSDKPLGGSFGTALLTTNTRIFRKDQKDLMNS